jgi:predicted ribosomally synthesized peptide with SipW-like signal peptide
MNSKLMKASLAGAAVVALAAGGGTFAAWSDFQSWTGNQSGAGTLTLSTTTPDTQAFHVGNLTPGQVYEKESYLLSNKSDSTPNGTLWLTLSNLVGHEDGCQGNSEVIADPNCANTAGVGQFPQDAKVFIKTNSSNQTTCNVVPSGSDAPAGFEHAIFGAAGPTSLDINGVDPVHEKSLSALAAAGPVQLVRPGDPALGFDPSVFKPGEGVCVDFFVYLPATTGNEVQGDQSTFDLTATLNQAI